MAVVSVPLVARWEALLALHTRRVRARPLLVSRHPSAFPPADERGDAGGGHETGGGR